ncbi:hypothetical protein VTJ83DRAFT_5696 [Remersonia thermophila]|uniref:C2H2-type domain-containing protein n=1 Tax=Remersonia thermophila TaxID=72144 RepID=A0ABR4D8J4_9PEZI
MASLHPVCDDAENRHREEHKSSIKDQGAVVHDKEVLPVVVGLMPHNPGGGLGLPDDVLPVGFRLAEEGSEESSGHSTSSLSPSTTSSTLPSSSSTSLSGWARSAKVKVFKAKNTHVGIQHDAATHEVRAWTQTKKLLEGATEDLLLLQQGSRPLHEQQHNEPTREYGPHDPRSPSWNPQRYYYSSLKKYKCPHAPCIKSFADMHKFREHLLSPEHNTKAKYTCPGCNKRFDTRKALSMHKASLGPRCPLRLMNGQAEEEGRMDARVKQGTPLDKARVWFDVSERK